MCCNNSVSQNDVYDNDANEDVDDHDHYHYIIISLYHYIIISLFHYIIVMPRKAETRLLVMCCNSVKHIDTFDDDANDDVDDHDDGEEDKDDDVVHHSNLGGI